MKKALMYWSGGKDSALALYCIMKEQEIEIKYLLTNCSENLLRVSMHGVKNEFIEMQAKILNLQMEFLFMPESPSMTDYEKLTEQKLKELSKENIELAVHGDIFLQDLRDYRDKQLEKIPLKGVYPLWNKSTRDLVNEFIDAGFKAIVICINTKYLSKFFCGRILDQSFLDDLPPEVDPCGENGEFHTFVFDGPIFHEPIQFSVGEMIYKEYKAPKTSKNTQSQGSIDYAQKMEDIQETYGFYFCELEPVSKEIGNLE